MKWDDCGLNFQIEDELSNHIIEEYDVNGWETTEKFCDSFCWGDLSIHTCRTEVDFQDYIRFDIHGTISTWDKDVIKCLKCDKLDEDIEHMKQHILEIYPVDKATKCSFSEIEVKNMLVLKNHYKKVHMNSE